MKYLLIVLLTCYFMPCSQAQLTVDAISSDTFRIQSFPLKIWYGLDRVKKPRVAEPYLLSLNDAQINRDWRVSKNLRLAGTIVQFGGLVVEGVGLWKTLNGEPNNLVLKGVGIMLGGVIIQVIANGPMKRSMFRHNFLKTRRFEPTVAPPIPTVYPAPSKPQQSPENKQMMPAATSQKGLKPGKTFIGLSVGFGRSKQKLNYEDLFDDPLKKAQVYSYTLQFGKDVTESFGWQIELGLSEHGFREEYSDYVEGVTLKSRSDARLRYVETPVLLAFKLPIRNSAFRLDAMPGASVGVLNSAKIVSVAQGEEDDTEVRLRVSSKLDLRGMEFDDKLDAALLFGLRGAFSYGPGRFFVEGRYHFGILNLDRNTEPSVFEEQKKSFNRSMFFRAGYHISLQ